MGLSTLRGHLGRNRGAMKREVFGKSNLMIVAALRRGWSGYADQPTVSRRKVGSRRNQRVVPYGSIAQLAEALSSNLRCCRSESYLNYQPTVAKTNGVK